MDCNVADMDESLAAVETDSALFEVGIAGFEERCSVEGDFQEIAGAFDAGGVPFAGGLVEIAGALNFVPAGFIAVTDEDGLVFIEVDVVVIPAIDGAEDEATGEDALVSGFDEKFGIERNIRVFMGCVESGGEPFETIEEEFAVFNAGGFVGEGPVGGSLGRVQIEGSLGGEAGACEDHDEKE